MEQTVTPARKVAGEVLVPGELEPAEKNLILAALGAGESRVQNVPPTIETLMTTLKTLGVEIRRQKNDLIVKGKGLRGVKASEKVLDLDPLYPDTVLILVGLLGAQSFVSRVNPGRHYEAVESLLQLLAPMGTSIERPEENVVAVGGKGELQGVEHGLLDVSLGHKLAVLLSGLGAEGVTSFRETAKSRDRVAHYLRQRQVEVERTRQEDGEQYLVSVAGGQEVQPLTLEIPGQLPLAYPFVVAALSLKGSELTLRRLMVRSENRALLDMVRQLGAPVELQEAGDGTTDLVVRAGAVKPTRIAGPRTEKVVEHVALLAVLATQATGQFVIRDVDHLRQGDYDFVAHLVELLRQRGAKVGEFPEGLVVDGGLPLSGGVIDAKGDVGLVLAFAVAGLLAEEEMTIQGAECLDGVYPDFFAALAAVKETRKSRTRG